MTDNALLVISGLRKYSLMRYRSKRKCTNTVSIQIAAKNLVCPELPVESEEMCVCVWHLYRERGKGRGGGEGESMRDLGKSRRHRLGG